MNIKGIQADTGALAAGLYDLICEQGQDHIVAFGMIPKAIVDLLEKNLREKVIGIVETKEMATIEEISRFFNVKAEVDSIVKAIIRQVCVDILSVAKQRGQMIV